MIADEHQRSGYGMTRGRSDAASRRLASGTMTGSTHVPAGSTELDVCLARRRMRCAASAVSGRRFRLQKVGQTCPIFDGQRGSRSGWQGSEATPFPRSARDRWLVRKTDCMRRSQRLGMYIWLWNIILQIRNCEKCTGDVARNPHPCWPPNVRLRNRIKPFGGFLRLNPRAARSTRTWKP